MKKIWKKNQIMITALAIMIAVAGYLNFAGEKLSDEDFLSMEADVVDTDISDEDVYAVNVTDVSDELSASLTNSANDIESLDENNPKITENYLDSSMEVADNDTEEIDETPGEAVFTSGTGISSLAGAKLIKEQTRAKNKETLLNIINSENVEETKKQDAINSMIVMTDVAEKESAAEVLLEAKGYEGVVVSITDQTADVIVGCDSLSDAQTAQIIDIVQRKTDITPENIVITMATTK